MTPGRRRHPSGPLVRLLVCLLLATGCGKDGAPGPTGPAGPAGSAGPPGPPGTSNPSAPTGVDLRGRWQVADSLFYGGTFNNGNQGRFAYAVSGSVTIDWLAGQGFVASGVVQGMSGSSSTSAAPVLAPVPTSPVNSLLQIRGDTLLGAGLAGQIVVTGFSATLITRVVTSPADVPCSLLAAQFTAASFTCRAVVRWAKLP